MGRLVGTVVVILVLYAVITSPQNSAAMTRNGVSALGVAADRFVVFITALVPGGSSGSTQISSVPTGGVATGDGSIER